jgi:hypothetical protein
MRVRAEDQHVFNIPKPRDNEHPGYYTRFDLSDLERRKGIRVVEIPFADYTTSFVTGSDIVIAILDGTENDVVRKTVPFPEAQARIDEIVAAIQQWRAEDDKIQESLSGMSSAEWDKLSDQQSEIFDAILSCSASTFDGLRVKARAVKIIHSDEEAIELGDTTDDQLAASVLNDLLAMATRA